MVYEHDPDRLPDDRFLPGALDLLVAGNEGRFLDARRTPFRLLEVNLRTGTFLTRITAFEDAGATWELELESFAGCQFSPDGERASKETVAAFRAAIERLDRIQEIPADDAARKQTETRIQAMQETASAWLDRESTFLRSGGTIRTGRLDTHPDLWADWRHFLDVWDLVDLETAFAERFVSNPYSGDLIKGHRIVLADLGLCPYRGKVVREPDLFDGRWSRERRAEHIVCRLGFLRALFARLGLERVILHRGMSFTGGLEPPRNESFVSTSFDPEVARSHFELSDPEGNGLLIRMRVPVERLFMTYLETEAMNRQFREGEAVLLFDPERTLI